MRQRSFLFVNSIVMILKEVILQNMRPVSKILHCLSWQVVYKPKTHICILRRNTEVIMPKSTGEKPYIRGLGAAIISWRWSV